MICSYVLLCIVVACASSVKDLPYAVDTNLIPETMRWKEWKNTFSSRLFTVDKKDSLRRKQFRLNLGKIKHQNALNDAGLSGYRLGVNQFSDLSEEEFKKAVGLDRPLKHDMNRKDPPTLDTESVPSSIDWRTHGAVTPVKNQANCGSCWSFGTTGAVEGAVFVATGQLVSLSEKQLVDCSTQNDGCDGGLIDWAMEYIVKNGGLDSEEDYPYEPRDGRCDHMKERKHSASISGYEDVRRGSATDLVAALASVPVGVAIEADTSIFQQYRTGVIDNYSCGTSIDHAVLAVGYTATNDSRHPNAFIVKNSWGPTWGDNGYVYISRSQQYSSDGICGILYSPTYATGGSVGPGPHPPPSPTPGPGPSPGPVPSSDPYGNPINGCNAGENPVTINRGDVGGTYCGVSCTSSATCPSIPTSYASVFPECLVQEDDVYSGETFCALRCNPNGSTCGSGSECLKWCTQGSPNYYCYWICAFDNSSLETPISDDM